MSEKKIRIISFDVPYPPDYGGVVDVFYKIKSLAELGVKIHLHCYSYGREVAPELERYCSSVEYYKRSLSPIHLINPLPFIVAGRVNENLIDHLSHSHEPLFFEGLHTCSHLAHPMLDDRLKMVRMHNIEHDYYKSLAQNEGRPLRKTYFNLEAKKLKSFENVLDAANCIFSISPNDTEKLASRFGNVSYLPAFHSNESAFYNPNREKFVLYHGNLNVPENEVACKFLINEIFKNSGHKLIIAGSNPKKQLRQLIESSENVKGIYNPGDMVLTKLLRNAKVSILPAFQNTGIKLKLIAAMFNAGHILTNKTMVENTGLEQYCQIANDPGGMTRILDDLMNRKFLKEEFEARVDFLDQKFNNLENAGIIADHL